MSKKMPDFSRDELEKLLKQLDQGKNAPAPSDEDLRYINPWNVSKKRASAKRTICASLPEELPE